MADHRLVNELQNIGQSWLASQAYRLPLEIQMELSAKLYEFMSHREAMIAYLDAVKREAVYLLEDEEGLFEASIQQNDLTIIDELDARLIGANLAGEFE